MSEPQKDLEYSRQLQEKFEFYVLALIFTLLGLAVQTAKFGSYPIADRFELLGWLSLLLSGTVGLSRIEWLPVAYKKNCSLTDHKSELAAIVAGVNEGVAEAL